MASPTAAPVIVGEILREKEAMLQMCRKLDFTVILEPADLAIILVRNSLAEN